MSKPEFPIYCKDKGAVHTHMIIAHDKVMTITNSVVEIGEAITQYHGIDHGVYRR